MNIHFRRGILPIAFVATALAFAGCANSTLPSAPPRGAVQSLPAAQSHDAFVLISGGGTPLSNNYSQYLQARAIATFFQERAAPGRSWVFFGAGNRTGEPPVFGDVHRQTKNDGLLIDSWVAGDLRDNHPAKRETILRALREEILPVVRDGGRLFLFVGDHGTESPGDDPESIITLWQMQPGAQRGWVTNKAENLGVRELRETLAAGLGTGRVVFCMTQCHSGGFHQLAVPPMFTFNPNWFTAMASDPADWKQAAVDLRIAGFTATDQESLAAGCMPDPDPDKWEGYERFVPEQLLGIDLFSGVRIGSGLPSFAAANEAATLVDNTIDKPRGTADFFLDRWADTIEALAQQPNLTPEIKRHIALYNRIADGAEPPDSFDSELAEKRAQFRRFTDALAERHPAIAGVLRTAPRRDLLFGVNAGPRSQPGQTGQSDGSRPAMLARLWDEKIRPAWKAAVLAGQTDVVPPLALPFEKHLLSLEDQNRDFTFGGRQANLPNETFWQSGLAFPATTDAEKAAAVTRWSAERRRAILAWAKNSPDLTLRDTYSLWISREPQRNAATDAPPGASRQFSAASERSARERVKFYRRVLGAWAFLEAAGETAALEQLHALQVLERTPLPSAKS